MTYDHYLEEFNKIGVLLTGDHFVYAEWDHGQDYFDKNKIYVHTQLTEEMCDDMILPFLEDDIDAVVAPEKGGIILSQWMAFHLSNRNEAGKEVLSFYAEKRLTVLSLSVVAQRSFFPASAFLSLKMSSIPVSR